MRGRGPPRQVGEAPRDPGAAPPAQPFPAQRCALTSACHPVRLTWIRCHLRPGGPGSGVQRPPWAATLVTCSPVPPPPRVRPAAGLIWEQPATLAPSPVSGSGEGPPALRTAPPPKLLAGSEDGDKAPPPASPRGLCSQPLDGELPPPASTLPWKTKPSPLGRASREPGTWEGEAGCCLMGAESQFHQTRGSADRRRWGSHR